MPPNDRAALARALRWLCDDATLRETQGARARRRALLFDPEHRAEGYFSLYASLCAERRVPTLREESIACAS